MAQDYYIYNSETGTYLYDGYAYDPWVANVLDATPFSKTDAKKRLEEYVKVFRVVALDERGE